MINLSYLNYLLLLIYDNFWYLILIAVLMISQKYLECGIFVVLAKIGFPLWSWQFVVITILYIWYEEFFGPRQFWKKFYKKRYDRAIKKYENKFSECVYQVSKKKEGS